jgi:hypothetical protein
VDEGREARKVRVDEGFESERENEREGGRENERERRIGIEQREKRTRDTGK